MANEWMEHRHEDWVATLGRLVWHIVSLALLVTAITAVMMVVARL